ncbi:MAG: cytochrome c [Casimicrobiaceae bacterium]
MNARHALCIAMIATAAIAYAQETKFELKPGPGRDLVTGNCAVCHSLDYIQGNSPFMTRQVWDAEVTKMIKAYGAPIPPESVPAIVDYLTSNYGVVMPAK